MAARWHKDMDHVSLVLSFLGSIRPSARATLYHPACTALCALVGVLLAATADYCIISIIGFFFVPKSNWLAGIFFTLLAACGGWLQLVACAWGFVHFACSAVEHVGPSFVERWLLYVSSLRFDHHKQKQHG